MLCAKCSFYCYKISLYVCNIIEFTFGLSLVIISLYVRLIVTPDISGNDPKSLQTQISYDAYGILTLGSLYVLMAAVSHMSISNSNTPFLIIPCGYLSILLALVSITVAIYLLIMQHGLKQSIDKSRNQFKISDDEVDLILEYFKFIPCLFFAVFTTSLIRFKVCIDMRTLMIILEEERLPLLGESTTAENDRANRSIKYDNMRTYYKSKYSRNNNDDV
mmetsp:Transcript_17886/g.17955  ORF Transcript_17886/g.17955 Transcript_17886/m.17955 type:complete len:219 (-) Transcript_17886:84-740(-)